MNRQLNRSGRRGYAKFGQTNIAPYRITLFILIIAIIVLSVFLVVNNSKFSQDKYEINIRKSVRSELQSANDQSNSLSRLSGSETSASIGKMRQYVHAIETLSNLNISILGESGRICQQQYFDTIEAVFNEYEVLLQSGSKTNEVYKRMSDILKEISNSVELYLNE